MSLKLLTVDDSKAVRMIVRKAFKSFDCEILEAANGVEGLAAASKDGPDLILLDVTMPVMDGIEMLTKLKADAKTKGIPVIMLTAEAGRENVMKIAKIGIRDYIVKPFKEEVLIEKAGRVVELRPKDTGNSKPKNIDDPIKLMLVEDKPAIVKQIEDGLSKLVPWQVIGLGSEQEGTAAAAKDVPDVAIISLGLAEEGGFNLFRALRANPKTKFLPIFGLCVKTATHEQQQAQEAGFASIITKPIDFNELVGKVSKALSLDTSARYFKTEEDMMIVHFPKIINDTATTEIYTYLNDKVSEAVDNGLARVVVDASDLEKIDTNLVKLFCDVQTACTELTLPVQFVAGADIAKACSQYEECKSWQFAESLDAVKAAAV